MAFYNNTSKMLDNCIDKTTKKVYVNPNFNKVQGNMYPNSAVMHVNPKFSHLLSNVQVNTHNKAKIYVNPNFVKPQSFHDINCIQHNTDTNYMNPVHSPKNEIISVTQSVAKSRYCLVRQNTSQVGAEPVVSKIKNTIQINKYKSVPLNDIKRNLDNVKNSSNKHLSSSFTRTTDKTLTINKKSLDSSDFSTKRLMNRDVDIVVTNYKIRPKSLIDSHRKTVLSQSKVKIKGNFKKNNIPCPTFRKFGKCLRKSYGKCEFLHDKKHVSICRKFIKGLCHDKDCLLSHDLTTKKMPTCYFYLKGTCTKSDCPYLHVKLNEKAQICSDFLKGYCEKGGKCLKRHIDTDKKERTSSVKTRSSLTSKRKYNKVKDKPLVDRDIKNDNKGTPTHSNKDNSDYRYYQEHKSDTNPTEVCEVIKPTRCKLGILPSFIQL